MFMSHEAAFCLSVLSADKKIVRLYSFVRSVYVFLCACLVVDCAGIERDVKQYGCRVTWRRDASGDLWRRAGKWQFVMFGEARRKLVKAGVRPVAWGGGVSIDMNINIHDVYGCITRPCIGCILAALERRGFKKWTISHWHKSNWFHCSFKKLYKWYLINK